MKTLEKWKRNRVFEAVRASGLMPEEFSWDGEADDIILRHVPSGAFFVFGGDAGNYLTRYEAGDDKGPELTAHTWDAQMRRVALWLSAVKRDIETPDLWDQFRHQTDLLADISDEDLQNTPFTSNERMEITRQLGQVREFSKSAYALTEKQLEDLDLKLDYLVDATTRLGRKDWLNVCIGTMFGWFLMAALPPEASHHIFEMLMTGLAHFIVHGIPGLGSG